MHSLAASVLLVLVTAPAGLAYCGMASTNRYGDEIQIAAAKLKAAGTVAEQCRARREMDNMWYLYLNAYKATMDCMFRDGGYNAAYAQEYGDNRDRAAQMRATTQRTCR